jgi:hypothetical protein
MVGYTYIPSRDRYGVRIRVNWTLIHLGYTKTEEEAKQMYDNYVIKHKLNRRLNNRIKPKIIDKYAMFDQKESEPHVPPELC